MLCRKLYLPVIPLYSASCFCISFSFLTFNPFSFFFTIYFFRCSLCNPVRGGESECQKQQTTEENQQEDHQGDGLIKWIDRQDNRQTPKQKKEWDDDDDTGCVDGWRNTGRRGDETILAGLCLKQLLACVWVELLCFFFFVLFVFWNQRRGVRRRLGDWGNPTTGF